MELYEQYGSIEEWLSQRRVHPWETNNPTDQIMNFHELLSTTNGLNTFDYYDDNLGASNYFPNSSCKGFSPPLDQELSPIDPYYPFGNQFHVSDSSYETPLSAAQTADNSSYSPYDTYPISSVVEEEEPHDVFTDDLAALEMLTSCKTEPVVSPDRVPVLVGQKGRTKRLEGQPSKNLMAERRRRKRLNDRLSMLRSIVPKISKMDRTSILGDTIDYMKELLEKIQNLQEEIESGNSNQLNMLQLLKDMKPNEMLVRNSPKFNVERRNEDTKVEICCSGKPGLLLSTVNTLEALGLEIQQCVISCFNDFALQASCSEELEQRPVMSPEDIKQALFRNAGYGGRCL